MYLTPGGWECVYNLGVVCRMLTGLSGTAVVDETQRYNMSVLLSHG